MSLDDGSANRGRETTNAFDPSTDHTSLPQFTQTRPSQDLPFRPGLVDDFDNGYPSPKTIPLDHVGTDSIDSIPSRDQPNGVVPAPNTGEKIVESPAAVKPITKPIAHSILANHNSDRLDTKRPRKSLSWDLPDDRSIPNGLNGTRSNGFVPASPLPEIVSQPPSLASDETSRDAAIDRSLSPGRFRSSPAPIEEPESNGTKEPTPQPPPKNQWWQRGPFYNDFTSGKNYSRVGSIASTHRPSVSTDGPPPRAPSVLSQMHWSERGRTSRRESTSGWRSRRSSYATDVCNNPHCPSHRYHGTQDLPDGCTCYMGPSRSCTIHFDDFSLFERSTTSTSFNTADISALPSQKGLSARDDPSESTESSGQRRRQRWNIMQDDFMNLQDDFHDLQRDVDDLERYRSRLQHDVDHLLEERRHLEQLTQMDEMLHKHLVRIESMIHGKIDRTDCQTKPDEAVASSSEPHSTRIPQAEASTGYIVFTEPFTRAQEYVLPISQCQTWNVSSLNHLEMLIANDLTGSEEHDSSFHETTWSTRQLLGQNRKRQIYYSRRKWPGSSSVDLGKFGSSRYAYPTNVLAG
jgi:hypothetical protein